VLQNKNWCYSFIIQDLPIKLLQKKIILKIFFAGFQKKEAGWLNEMNSNPAFPAFWKDISRLLKNNA
jgi:hypothetical protein